MLKHHQIGRKELWQAQLALLVAIGLQLLTRHWGTDILPGTQYFLIFTELILAILIGLTANHQKAHDLGLHHIIAVILLALISAANISGLVYVARSLITGHSPVNGEQLLAAAIAIFITNIIVYALWYWEIDSPGLTRTRWSKNAQDFQFIQQDPGQVFPNWEPEFLDFLFLAVTNALSFAPADARPLTHQAKMLMSSQSIISIFTLSLVLSRAVGILGS